MKFVCPMCGKEVVEVELKFNAREPQSIWVHKSRDPEESGDIWSRHIRQFDQVEAIELGGDILDNTISNLLAFEHGDISPIKIEIIGVDK